MLYYFFMATHRDEESRRHQVGEALLLVISEHGLEGTTLRQVAATAGVSVGLVQRYFRTKAELLTFGIEYVTQRTMERIYSAPGTPPFRARLQRIIEELLPLDEDREQEVRVWLAFAHSSMANPEQARIHHDMVDQSLDWVRAELHGAQASGELSADMAPDTAAAALTAFVSGLSLHGVTDPDRFGPDVLRAAITAQLDLVFKGGNP